MYDEKNKEQKPNGMKWKIVFHQIPNIDAPVFYFCVTQRKIFGIIPIRKDMIHVNNNATYKKKHELIEREIV